MKRVRFLYFFLGMFLIIGVFGVCLLLFTPKEPSVIEEYDYSGIQDLVIPSSSCFSSETGSCAPSVNTTEPSAFPEVCLSYDYNEMISINSDFKAWLYIPDTEISLPVVIGEDNYFYLDRSFTGGSSAFGCLYFDVNTIHDTQNRVIHGHNMGNNRTEMFSTLVKFQDQDYAEEHKYLYLSESEGQTDVYQLFAVLNFDLNLYLGDWNYIGEPFETESEREEYVNFLQGLSLYKTSFYPTGDILILSTCNRAYGTSNRLLICASKISFDAP